MFVEFEGMNRKPVAIRTESIIGFKEMPTLPEEDGPCMFIYTTSHTFTVKCSYDSVVEELEKHI